MIAQRKSNMDLSESEKWAIVAGCLNCYDSEKKRLRDGSMVVLTSRYKISERSIQKIFAEYKEKNSAGVAYPDLAPKSRSACGPDSSLVEEVIENIIDLHNMTKGEKTIKQMAQLYLREFGVAISSSSMHRYLKELGSKTRTSYVKPKLTTDQRIARLEFILGKTHHNGAQTYQFYDGKNRIDIDEKWFYATQLKKRVRILPNDDRVDDVVTRHKSHIEKVMFLSVIGVPQTVMHEGVEIIFDGKIGIFPFIRIGVAQRASRLRPAGAPVLEYLNVTAEVYREFMLKEGGVLDKVKEKMPWLKESTIYIQHDGAPGHNGKGNLAAFSEAGQQDGWNIVFETQPAQSPDCNKNDLCFFNSLQHRAEELKMGNETKEKLMEAVTKAFNDYPVDTLVRIHAFQYATYREILKNAGGNQFYQPHSDIRKREIDGEEVSDLKVPYHLILQARESLFALKGYA